MDSSPAFPRLSQISARLPARLSAITLWSGGILLALDPLDWLIGTWYQAGYDGIGWVAFLAVLGLAGLSLRTPVQALTRSAATPTFILLGLTALLRLVSQMLDIDVVGALLLAVDVYALARLARLHERRFPVSPFWLGVLFCFCLPIEPMLQRVAGFALQQISALLACGMLTPWFGDLVCEGVRLRVNGMDVLVDLPCSGAELMSVSAFVFSIINAVHRPGFRWGLISTLSCVLLALLGNGLRITMLATGIVFEAQIGFSVMAALPHTLIGLAIVALVSAALLAITRLYPERHSERCCDPNTTRSRSVPLGDASHPPSTLTRPLPRLVFALGFVLFALLVGAIQPRPLDASPVRSAPEIPWVAAGFLRGDAPLSAQEQRYFERYGGGAARAAFGPYGLLLVTTASPLRHLHDPLICLRGAGFAVDMLGTDHARGATLYRAAQAGESYLVEVTYRSDAGQLAMSVAEVVWHWLKDPSAGWTMTQLVIPENPAVDAVRTAEWRSAMRRAFNLG